ncbi:FG-GAP-like repeat-containing protein [Streptomyces fulvoviolaceus]|uniref:FG-GAP-like repeat-containing protein n=1 Tax=Streptomyces fulvoviolaceus TaxID=285535 RepID=UPI0004C6D702|nr:FG-GAP-like repeat-containing protein [Streptomyces fulvoviolaceus]MCT9078906.1 VCBS repeat-containing protein [Streptomyces fulvoviolaceus]
MRKRTLLLAATLTTGLLTVALPGTATAAPSGLAGDFNGDGYRDVAIGADSAKVGSVSGAGAVVVLYGSSTGVSAAKKTVITQNSTGVPGTAEEGDRFGNSLAAGDLNADGYADLVVGAQYEGVGTFDGVGAATVIWGSKSGLTGGSALPSPAGLNEWGGYSSGVATGDFDGDGKTDVTVTGQSRTGLYKGPFARTGKPVSLTDVYEVGSTYEVIAGDLDADGAAERVYPYTVSSDHGGVINYLSHDPGNESHPESDYIGTELTEADGHQGVVGDINGDGYGDLVLGDHEDPRSDKKTGHKGGQISVWYGSATGPDPEQTPTVIHQDSTGVPGAGEAEDLFGAALSVGDINGDKYADVAVGAPGEDNGTAKSSGSVTILFGSATGLKGSGAKSYTQNTAGVPGSNESYDAFGQSVRLVDINKNGKADLVAGAGGENNYGAVTVLRGSASGLTTTSAKYLSARDVSLKGDASFGWVIAQ